MSCNFRGTLGALCLTGSAALAFGNLAVAQEPIEPPMPGIVLEIAPTVTGDVVEFAPAGGSFSATLAIDGGSGPVFFSRAIDETPESLLDQGHVQKELDLIDEQKEKLQKAQRKMQEGMQKHFAEQRERHMVRIRDLQDEQASRSSGGNSGKRSGRAEAGGRAEGAASGSAGGSSGGSGEADIRIRERRAAEDAEDFKKSQDRIKELRDDLAKEVDKILLPHQRRRLEEIALRTRMKNRGTTSSLVDTELAKTLSIGDAQKERIRRRAAEVQKKLDEEIAKLREEAREEILEELTPEQQRKLKDLMGKEIDDKPQAAPQRIRRPAPPTESKPATEEKPAEKADSPEPDPNRGS